MSLLRLLILAIFSLSWLPIPASAQSLEREENPPPSRVARLKSDFDKAHDIGGVLFLYGAFCALWAQNTRRSAWLWFFLGFLFSAVAVVFLLVKNSDDNFDLRRFGRTTRGRKAPRE